MVSRSKSEPLGQPYTRNETGVFNPDLREVLRQQGLGALHVREADLPGVFDLLVTEASGTHRHLWLELKIFAEVEPSQIGFARARTSAGELCVVGRLKEDHSLTLTDYTEAHEFMWVSDFRTCLWRQSIAGLLDRHYRK